MQKSSKYASTVNILLTHLIRVGTNNRLLRRRVVNQENSVETRI